MMRNQEAVNDLFTKLMCSPCQTFPALGKKLTAPDRQGVYVIYSPRGKVLHVGRTSKAKKGISQRLCGHMSGSSSFTKVYLKKKGSKLRGKYKFRYIAVKNKWHRAYLEAYAIGTLCPAHIGTG